MSKSNRPPSTQAQRSAQEKEPIPYAELPSAGVARRLMAMVYDLLVLAALWLLTGFIHAAIVGIDNLERADNLSVTLFPALLTVTFLFYFWFWRHGGQTLGMRAWRLQVIDARLDGRPVSFGQALSRFLVSILSLCTFGLGYWWILISASGDSWHDSLSNTRTVLLTKTMNKALVPSRRIPR